MRPGRSCSETVQRAKRARRSLTVHGALWGVLLVANTAVAYAAVADLGSRMPPEGVALDAVVRIETSANVGSGFLVTPEYVLTAAHVVGDTGVRVRMTFTDGQVVEGTVVASGHRDLQAFVVDAQAVRDGATPHDWAVVRLDQPQASGAVLYLGDSSLLAEGEGVWAVGYPGGGARNLTQGVISGRADEELRTDAGLDPGYSGGPLISATQKAVVGILLSIPEIAGRPADSVRNAVPIEVVIRKAAAAGHPIE